MINSADDCRRRAEECLAAAHFASDLDVKRTWMQLSDLWLLWAQEFGKVRINLERPEVAGNAEKKVHSEVAPEQTIGRARSVDVNAMRVGDRLRARLALTELKDTAQRFRGADE